MALVEKMMMPSWHRIAMIVPIHTGFNHVGKVPYQPVAPVAHHSREIGPIVPMSPRLVVENEKKMGKFGAALGRLG